MKRLKHFLLRIDILIHLIFAIKCFKKDSFLFVNTSFISIVLTAFLGLINLSSKPTLDLKKVLTNFILNKLRQKTLEINAQRSLESTFCLFSIKPLNLCIESSDDLKSLFSKRYKSLDERRFQLVKKFSRSYRKKYRNPVDAPQFLDYKYYEKLYNLK